MSLDRLRYELRGLERGDIESAFQTVVSKAPDDFSQLITQLVIKKEDFGFENLARLLNTADFVSSISDHDASEGVMLASGTAASCLTIIEATPPIYQTELKLINPDQIAVCYLAASSQYDNPVELLAESEALKRDYPGIGALGEIATQFVETEGMHLKGDRWLHAGTMFIQGVATVPLAFKSLLEAKPARE